MKRKMALLVSSFLFVCSLVVWADPGFQVEVAGDWSIIDPEEYDQDLAESMKKMYTGGVAIAAADRSTDRVLNVSSSLKYFFKRLFSFGIAGAYNLENTNTTLKINDVDSLFSELMISTAYAGLNAGLSVNPNPKLSVFTEADAGFLFPLAMHYNFGAVAGSAAQDELIPLGIDAEKVSDSAPTESADPGFSASLRLGVRWFMSKTFGISMFAGYRKADFPLAYPARTPFTITGGGGEPIFRDTNVNLSGPFLGMGIVYKPGRKSKKADPEMPSAPEFRNTGLTPYQATTDDETSKYLAMAVTQASYFNPTYHNPLQLFVSTRSGKPATIPTALTTIPLIVNSPATVQPVQSSNREVQIAPPSSLVDDILPIKPVSYEPIYTMASYGSFIDSSGDPKRWFAYHLADGTRAANVVWQVSTAPFPGGVDGWRSPPAIVASGEVDASVKEFTVDFGNLKQQQFTFRRSLLAARSSQINDRRSYYVRAVAVDQRGNPIGEPDHGIAVIYGQPVARTASVPVHELRSPLSPIGHYTGENQDRPYHRVELDQQPALDNVRLFHFHGEIQPSSQIILQVSQIPFLPGDDGPDSRNVIHTVKADLPVPPTGVLGDPWRNEYPISLLLDFNEFAKKASEVKENEYTRYYVRGLVVTPSQTPGYVDVDRTDTITVNYGYGKTNFEFVPGPTTVPIGRSLPRIRITGYTPVQWQAPDCFSHFYVTRPPMADEIVCNWQNAVTGEILFPFDYVHREFYYDALGITTKQQYEQIIIPKVLPPDARVYFPPPGDDDKSWYQELFDGVVGFFEDLWVAAKTLVDRVSAAYNDLKAGLVSAIADLCPVPELRDEFKVALEGMANYGLMAVGLPPTLPNFDELSEMSLDYLAETALTEAGVPANEFTEGKLRDIADGIGKQITAAANRPAPNPVNAGFLKLDPEFIYRPAYVDIEIKNDTDYYTVPGSFDLNVTFEFDYYNMYASQNELGLSFDTPYFNAYGWSGGIGSASRYMEHFTRGLNGYTVDFRNADTAVYDVFYPQMEQTVPILRPNETRTVRIYFELYSDRGISQMRRYPQGEGLSRHDFEVMYFANGYKEFTHFNIDGHFPTADVFMADNGILNPYPNTVQVYESNGSPNDRVQKPVLNAWNR